MVILRFMAFVGLITIALSIAMWLFTRNPRYLNFTWQLVKFLVVFAVVVMALFVLERLILVI
ncbi:MAG TPA: hypothetical protein VLV32_05230 [Burkholderiales bacterium]|nr:hypothetical protein [Burkholderiales bacterium]